MFSKIYTGWDKEEVPKKIQRDLQAIVDDTLYRKKQDKSGPIEIFFRADDIGPPSKNYTRMMELFIKYQTPLCLAVVPVWMTKARWEAMEDFMTRGGELFCWHMHGYMHRNYETTGKKQEFGPARSAHSLFQNLSKGQKRLQTIMADNITPVFTPPWNRCSFEAMEQLKNLGFKGISRSYGSKPLEPVGFKDMPVHLDLHTRKEKDAHTGWQKLLEEFQNRLSISPCGIMLHHMRMNDAAFIFLEYLLALFAGYDQIKSVTYRDLI